MFTKPSMTKSKRSTNRGSVRRAAKVSKASLKGKRSSTHVSFIDRVKAFRLSGQQTWRFALFGGLLLTIGFIMSFSNWLSNPANLSINNVSIKGSFEHLQQADLRPVIKPYVNTNLSNLDVLGLEKALEEHPWVSDASLVKEWPRKLVINLKEHRPVAYWGNDQLLSRNGTVFAGKLVGEKEMPLLYSPTDDGYVMGTRYLQVLKQLESVPEKMMSLTENERGSWEIHFKNGVVLKVGKKDQDKRLRRFVVAYHKALKPQMEEISVVDLRYTNGFAVAWK